MIRDNGMNSDLESAIQNVICAADLASGPIEAAISDETASYAFYKLLEEIEALRRAADAQYADPEAERKEVSAIMSAAPSPSPHLTKPDWTGSRHG